LKYHTFCAANSGKGFISFFDSILNEHKKDVYYIKGGPGCGKSTLMKKIASNCEDAELIFCSGDPASLDGVITPNAVIIDATAPHSHEPKYPGVGGNLIDLGICWIKDSLNKDVIINLNNKKATVYNDCYNLLKSAYHLQKTIMSSTEREFSKEYAIQICNKILKQNALWEKRDVSCAPDKRFLSAISSDGLITLGETFQKLGPNIILLDDRWSISGLLLNTMDLLLQQRNIPHINGYHPLLAQEFIQHIIIPEAKLSIVSRDIFAPKTNEEEPFVRKISCASLLNKAFIEANKNKLTFIKKLQKETLLLAIEKLTEARSLHLKIEEEYAKGIDFSRAEDLKENLINKLRP
jgi:hypothetical protein